ncbi:MAG: putative endonuclease [Pyrinomonadaceae bacterium]|jgi:putative endonuclease|nr:putative endonuclease [Pyrinomonadaceae bacterium]
MNSSTIETSPSKVDAFQQLELGRRGEALAAAYLQQLGYRIVASNFALPVGRNRLGVAINVEIDLVAYQGDTLCFVEVKSRASDWFAPPQANVDRRKQRQIARAARAYRRMFGLVGQPYRYDVVTIVFGDEEALRLAPKIDLLRNYWTEDQLRKRTWSDRYYD